MFLLINRNEAPEIIANKSIKIEILVTIKDKINKIVASKKKIIIPTFNPSRYKTIINAMKTKAKPVSSCINLIINKGTTIKDKATKVFL